MKDAGILDGDLLVADRAAKPVNGSVIARGCKARIAAVHQIIPEHEPKVTRMIDCELHKGKSNRRYIGYYILRMPSTVDVSARSLIGQDCNFCKQAFGTAEMVCGSC